MIFYKAIHGQNGYNFRYLTICIVYMCLNLVFVYELVLITVLIEAPKERTNIKKEHTSLWISCFLILKALFSSLYSKDFHELEVLK